MIKKLFAALSLAALTACATTPPNPIQPAQRASVFVEDVSLTWSAEDGQRAANPEFVAGKADMQKRLEAAVEQEFANSPSGSEPVEFVVDVKTYNRVGAAMGNLVGGANTVAADVTVRRKSDGAVLGTYTGVTGMYASNMGIIGAIAQAASRPDIVGIMSNTFAKNLRARYEGK